jgi:LCP family protein required for cell wall assembly
MLNIPRDLWVIYDQPCSFGYSGKINAIYICAMESNNNDKKIAATMFAKKISEVLGTNVPYYAAVNYSVIRDLTNALGGINVDVYSDDPRGLYDARMDLYLPKGVSYLDGETALKLARARNSKGGYGLGLSNFDREKNQQRIIKGMQKKASVAGILLDPNKTLEILDSLGNNIHTNIDMSELRTAISVANAVNADDIVSLPLIGDGVRLVTTDGHNGMSIVRPVRGLLDYAEIQEYVREAFLR